MSEATGTDANDDLERSQQLQRGALLEQVSTRHLAYRRALEAHRERLQHELDLVVATAADPVQHYPTRLPNTWARVREARQLYEAARAALTSYTGLQ